MSKAPIIILAIVLFALAAALFKTKSGLLKIIAVFLANLAFALLAIFYFV